MKYIKWLAVITVLFVAVACTSGDKPAAGNYAADVDALNALLAEHVAAVNSGDTTANLDAFTGDVVYLPPDQPVVIGKSALTAYIGSFYAAFDAEIDMVPEETVVFGDWAFQRGSVTGTIQPLDGGQTTTLDWKYLYIFQREPDGTWKIARDIFNSNVPPVQTE